MNPKPSRTVRSIDDPRPVGPHVDAVHVLRQGAAAVLLPRFRTGRRRLEALLAADPDVLTRVRHVAIVHWENLGDAVILSGFLRELRRNLPSAEITLVHNSATTELFELCPYIDRAFPVDVRSDGLHRHERSYTSKMWRTARILRRAARGTPIDLVVGPDWLDTVSGRTMWDNLLTRRAAGPTMVAARSAAGADVDIEVRQHHVPRTLRVLEILGGTVDDDRLEVWLDDADERAAGELGGDGSNIAVLAPGASVARRCWPPERFAELAGWLREHHSLQVVVLGSVVDRDRPGMDTLLGTPGVIDAVGLLPLRASAGVIRRATIFVGNDSGPAHLAAGVGTPAIVVSAHPRSGDPWMFNSPMRYRPWGVPSVVLQPATAAAGCDRGCTAPLAHCITAVTVDETRAALERVLAEVHP